MLNGELVVWDVRTGVIIRRVIVYAEDPNWIIFHGDQRTIISVSNWNFRTYDALNGTQLSNNTLYSRYRELGAHWTHKDTLQFAMSLLNTDGKTVVNIYDIRPTSKPPLHVLSSFPVPHSSGFSFSPIPFHVSFYATEGVVVFDVQDSKLLLQVKVAGRPYPRTGKFSPDGRFFACQRSDLEIGVWRNMPAGYVPWNSFRSRSPFEGYSWSPTSISILCWGGSGIQILCPENSLSLQSLDDKVEPCGKHLVTYSTDGKRIATARQDSNIVTVLDRLSGTSRQFNTNMQIQDIKIADNTVFVVDMHELVGWDIEAGGIMRSARGTWGAAVDETLDIGAPRYHLTLSHDCSRSAFTDGSNLFLGRRSPLDDSWLFQVRRSLFYDMPHTTENIRLSLDGHRLQYTLGDCCGGFVELAGLRSPTEDRESSLPPGRYNVEGGPGWVMDWRNRKLLWLPLNLRTTRPGEELWDGKFLALVDAHHPEPVIIEFQS